MSTIVDNPSVTCFDVDDTLVIWPKDFRVAKPGRIAFNYGDEVVWLIPHSYHTIFLKHCYNRGDFVIVWSANGSMWANQVVATLGLINHCNLIIQKPTRHVDDKESISSIAGNRVFIPHDNYDTYKIGETKE